MMNNKIIRHDNSKTYLDLCLKALAAHKESPLEQLEYMKEHGTPQYYTMFLVELVNEKCFNCDIDKNLNIKASEMELILRAFFDALRHLQPDLPDGVYEYIISKMNAPMLKVLKSALRGKVVRRLIKTHWYGRWQ